MLDMFCQIVYATYSAAERVALGVSLGYEELGVACNPDVKIVACGITKSSETPAIAPRSLTSSAMAWLTSKRIEKSHLLFFHLNMVRIFFLKMIDV